MCRIHGLVVIEGMNLSGHPWIINEIRCSSYWANLSLHFYSASMILSVSIFNISNVFIDGKKGVQP